MFPTEICNLFFRFYMHFADFQFWYHDICWILVTYDVDTIRYAHLCLTFTRFECRNLIFCDYMDFLGCVSKNLQRSRSQFQYQILNLKIETWNRNLDPEFEISSLFFFKIYKIKLSRSRARFHWDRGRDLEAEISISFLFILII